MGYVVIIANEGCAEEFVGRARTLRAARHLAHEHARGRVAATPSHLYETARAAGNPVEGCDYPESHDNEPVEWVQSRFAARNAYAIARTREED